MHSKNSILSAISRLWALPGPRMRELRSTTEKASESDLQTIARVVDRALNMQDAMLTKLVKNDPELPNKLQNFLHDAVQGTQAEILAKDEIYLEAITKQLESP